MKPFSLSPFWQRRLYEVIGSFSLVILLLAALPYVITLPQSLTLSMFVAGGAGVSLVLAIIGMTICKKHPSFVLLLLTFITLGATSALLIYETGGTYSPFVALWLLISFCSAIFGLWGFLPVLFASATFLTFRALTNDLGFGEASLISFTSFVPLAIGLAVWREHTGGDTETKNVKHLASQLSEVANKSEIVINAIGDGVIAVDGKGTIQLINPAAQSLLGWTKQDAQLLSFNSVLQLIDQNNAALAPETNPVQQVLNINQQVRESNITVLTKSGKKIELALVASPVGDPGNGAIIVFRDVSKERAEEREQAEFISTASHEMRTPVASIEGYLGLALNPNTAQIDDKARDFIMKAHEAAQHLGHLFQDLLDVSKSEDGRMTNTPRVVDLTALAGTITQGLAAKAAEKNLQLIYKPLEDDGVKKITPVYYINQDNDHVREILDNLIENAIKYTPQGSVTVDINGETETVTVSIKDTGLGIPAEDIAHLFQKFYRVDNLDRQQIGGTGLGLYLSRRLAESMGGRLWVESVHGQGSTFFLQLPRVSTQEAERLKTEQAAAAPVVQPVVTAPVVTPEAPTQPEPTAVQPATTVPRGESLTREQIAERVRQLEALSRAQQAGPPAPRPPQPGQPTP